MKLSSIEWVREKMKDVFEFQCRCGKIYDNFDLWWNHITISRHMVLMESEIEDWMGLVNEK